MLVALTLPDVSGLKPLSREAAGWLLSLMSLSLPIITKQSLVMLRRFSQRPEVAASAAGKNGDVYFWPANDFLRYGLNSPSVLGKLNSVAK